MIGEECESRGALGAMSIEVTGEAVLVGAGLAGIVEKVESFFAGGAD